MRNGMKSVFFGLSFLCALSAYSSDSRECSRDGSDLIEDQFRPSCPYPDGGGGDIPTPFGLINQKVELADGEYYLLDGTVVIDEGFIQGKVQAWFEVDFIKHPWLANRKRKQFPRYPLEGSFHFWKQYRGQKVRLMCKARGKFVPVPGRVPQYVISLEMAYDRDAIRSAN